jgi:hypothetical protein
VGPHCACMYDLFTVLFYVCGQAYLVCPKPPHASAHSTACSPRSRVFSPTCRRAHRVSLGGGAAGGLQRAEPGLAG